MGMRGLRAGVLAFGLLLVGLPAVAQDEATPVTFGDIGFALPPTLGGGVDVTVTPGDSPGSDPFVVSQPPAIVFTVHPGRGEGERLPRIAAGDTVIRAYRIADLAPYPDAMKQVDALKAILEERPELRPYTLPGGERLPVLPLGDLGQVLRVRALYLNTPTVSGVRYLTAYEQPGDGGPLDRFPLTSDSLVATYQGISTDGEWYISAMQQLETPLFPDEPSPKEIDRAARRWDDYLAETLAAIKAASRDDFTPSLDIVDTLLHTIGAGAPGKTE